MSVTSKLYITKTLNFYSVQNYACYPPHYTSMATFDILDNVKKGDVKKNLTKQTTNLGYVMDLCYKNIKRKVYQSGGYLQVVYYIFYRI